MSASICGNCDAARISPIVCAIFAEHSPHGSSGCGWYDGAAAALPSRVASNASTVIPIRMARTRQCERLM